MRSNWLLYAIRSAIYELSDFLLAFYSYNSAITHRNFVFSRWPWSDLSRSPKVKLTTQSDPRPMSSYKRSIVTIALSRTEIMFFSRWPWSDLSRSPKVKLTTQSDPRPMSSNKRSIATIALSRTEIVFFSRWPWSDLSSSPKVNVKLITPSVLRPVS